MISAQQEMAMQAANDRTSKKRQDKTNPHVINIDNGRLMPNTPRLRAHKDYRVYTGPKDATDDERMEWLSRGGRRAVRVTDSTPEPTTFDLGKASQADMVMFAFENYGLTLDENMAPIELRKIIKAKADAEAAAELA